MSSVAEQYWREVLDIRQPLEPVKASHAKRSRAVLVRRPARRDPRESGRTGPIPQR
jgi:hypothetical protein